MLDDLTLVARARVAPDTAAYGELVRRHQSQVRMFLLRLCRDRALADDLAQDTFLRAWQKLDTFGGHGSFIGWLLKIAWTTFLQARRTRQRYRDALERAAAEPGGEPVDGVGEETGDLERLLDVLGEEERAIMVLAYGCGLSHREIGEATGMPVGTIKSVIHRGKQKIRQEFGIEHHQFG